VQASRSNTSIDIRISELIFESPPRVGSAMQYRQFEEALIGMFSIDETNLGAFRARLRHLRNLGVPNIPKRGSGNALSYSQNDLFTTSVALALQMHGFAPATSAILAKSAAGHLYLLEQREVFLIVANLPKLTPANIEDTPGIRPGILGFSWIKNQFGGDTYACIVLGAPAAGQVVTSTKSIACSLINLSERFRALPKDI
jgi:hypothetical protein